MCVRRHLRAMRVTDNVMTSSNCCDSHSDILLNLSLPPYVLIIKRPVVELHAKRTYIVNN